MPGGGAVEAAGEHLADQSGHPREGGEQREDRGVAGRGRRRPTGGSPEPGLSASASSVVTELGRSAPLRLLGRLGGGGRRPADRCSENRPTRSPRPRARPCAPRYRREAAVSSRSSAPGVPGTRCGVVLHERRIVDSWHPGRRTSPPAPRRAARSGPDRYGSPSLYGQHRIPEEAQSAQERERLENKRYTSSIKTYFRRLEAAVAAGEDERWRGGFASSRRRSTRPSSAGAAQEHPSRKKGSRTRHPSRRRSLASQLNASLLESRRLAGRFVVPGAVALGGRSSAGCSRQRPGLPPHALRGSAG